jgi:membrane protein DedA with SNARE-associated domain
MTFESIITRYGEIVVALLIALECVGIPLPGETVLVAAAVFAGTTHDISIWAVVGSAIIGAFVGNIVGYTIGRVFGYPLLVRYGSYVHLTESRIKIGQYLFLRYGFEVVALARFVAVLRSAAGILAGANKMPLRPFLLANVIGAVIWGSFYGFGAYYLGDHAKRLAGPIGIVLAIVVVAAIVGGAIYLARREADLAEAAERTFPGPLNIR